MGVSEIDIMEGWGSAGRRYDHYGAQWPDNVYSQEYLLPGNSTIEQFPLFHRMGINPLVCGRCNTRPKMTTA
jgi:hypothetical protein